MKMQGEFRFSGNHHDISFELNGNIVNRKSLPLLKKFANDKFLKDADTTEKIFDILISKEVLRDELIKEFNEKIDKLMEETQSEIEILFK